MKEFSPTGIPALGCNAHYSELTDGMLVQVDNGFTCIRPWSVCVVIEAAPGAFHLKCNDGQHSLDGQLSSSDDDTLAGVFRLPNSSAPDQVHSSAVFQPRVQPWLMECFGHTTASDKLERNHRFLEEALELVQSIGCTASEAHQLVDYVFGRPIGESGQEVGGVMLTLAALCLANDLDMHNLAETELVRVWGKIDDIRAKQAAKPKHSPLPGAVAETIETDGVIR